MKTTAVLRIAFLAAGLFSFGLLQAQDAEIETTDESADVWAIVEAQWNAEEQGSKGWIDNLLTEEDGANGWIERLLTEDFAGWSKNSPAPRSKSSIAMWDRFTDTQGKMVAHELYPLSIIVHEDVAIAHYLYTSANEDADGKVESSNGRFTDVLVRAEDGWRFIAWHGGDDE